MSMSVHGQGLIAEKKMYCHKILGKKARKQQLFDQFMQCGREPQSMGRNRQF